MKIHFKQYLQEKRFNIDSSNEDEIFKIFKDSYEQSIGVSWTKDKFLSRAYNWELYGDENGFVAVRPQKSGMLKLVGVAGNNKSIYKGMQELLATKKPIWGMVSKEISDIMHKLKFITPPTFVIKLLLPMIPKNVFGNVDYTLNKDGSITLDYEDVGKATKFFVATKEYYKYLLTNKSIPIPGIVKTFISKL
jgi:hypothetical protein